MITITNLTYRINNRPIIEEANLTLMDNWKTGIVGPNGAGKSTLFKLIMGELHPDGGDIELNTKRSIGIIRQDLPDNDDKILDIVLAADIERADLLARSETETDPYKIADIHTRLNDIEAYTAPARASSILAGLGFTEEQLSHPIKSFSGGWKMRVALAAALFQQPDILLLDEPTNHLDLEAIMWLEAYLPTYPHSLLIISHDRDLLNITCDHIAHVENKQLTLYTGNYDTFERERAERRGLQQKMHVKQQAQIAHMQKFVDRFKAKASKATQAQSRIKALEKMDVVSAVMAERTIKFTFPQPDEMPPPLISITDVNLGYGKDAPILRNIDERIDMDDRIALLGANGNGKSTLIKFLAGRLKPQHGSLDHANKLRIGYFSQYQTDELDMTSTPFAEMMRLMRGNPEAGVRSKLGRFGFNKTLQDNQISALSGGEKVRLLFALISYNAPHILLLDEPTNHLDIDAREALTQALLEYEGAVVIVSHDPSMLERVADRLWLVQDGVVRNFNGDLADYRQMIIDNRRQAKKNKNKDKKANKPSDNEVEKLAGAHPTMGKKQLKQLAAQKRKKNPELHAKLQAAEKEVSKLNRQKQDLEEKLGETDLYDDQQKAVNLQTQYNKLVQTISGAESTWLELQETYDAL